MLLTALDVSDGQHLDLIPEQLAMQVACSAANIPSFAQDWYKMTCKAGANSFERLHYDAKPLRSVTATNAS